MSTHATIIIAYTFECSGVAIFNESDIQPWYQTPSTVNLPPCPTTPCPTITASPASVYHDASGHVVVTYTIESNANVTGLYAVFLGGLGGGLCTLVHLSFGPVPSSVFLFGWSCGPRVPGGLASWNITNLTNIDIVYVPGT
jgi:hypothetical protein